MSMFVIFVTYFVQTQHPFSVESSFWHECKDEGRLFLFLDAKRS